MNILLFQTQNKSFSEGLQGAGVQDLINEYVRQFSNNGMKTELKGVQGAEVCDLGCEYTKEE